MSQVRHFPCIATRAVLLGILGVSLGLAQSPGLAGIAHVAFRVGDLRSSRAFYSKLGYEEAFAVTQGGEIRQAFFKLNDRQFIELYPRTEPSQPIELMHVCYESDALGAVQSAYSQRGLQPTAIRKAGAGNLLFTMRGPEQEVIEYTQYMPGSRHTEDRGKHLGARRVSTEMVGAAFPVRSVSEERVYYSGKLGFEASDGGGSGRLRIPGGSGHFVELRSRAGQTKPGLYFLVPDVARAAEELRSWGLAVKTTPTAATVHDPDGNTIIFAASVALE